MQEEYERCMFYSLIDNEVPPAKFLLEGIILSTDRHDTSNPKIHTHWHRKVMQDYNPQTKSVLLSKEASANCLQNLQSPDKLFTIDELYSGDWQIRSKEYKIF
jgi:hypothetical protein